MALDNLRLGLALNPHGDTDRADGKRLALTTQVTVLASLLITLVAGVKNFTVDVPGLKTGDTVVVVGVSLPGIYELRSWSVPQDGKLSLNVYCPILSTGGLPLLFSLQAFR